MITLPILGKIRDGNLRISVHSEDASTTPRAKEVFEKAGAEHISSLGLLRFSGVASGNRKRP